MSLQPPLKAAIVPVTPLQQNCTVLWCTNTMEAAVVDPGGDLPRIRAAVEQAGAKVTQVWLTHGHLDHCGAAKPLARELGVPIVGPQEADRFWIARLEDDAKQWGMAAETFEPDRWLEHGDTVTLGDLTLDVILVPGHTPGHVVFHHAPSRLLIAGDTLFAGSVGRTDFPMSDGQALLDAIRGKLFPLGDDTVVLPGHGPHTTIGRERAHNPWVGEGAA